ncbi:MAG: peptidase M20 [Hyphomonadaceae bacterium]
MTGTPAGSPLVACDISKDDVEAIKAAIDKEELTTLVLELSNIYSPSTKEKMAADYVHDWMAREGFNPRAVGATPERPNVIGTYGGHGAGPNLLFTAHLDTESIFDDPHLDGMTKRPGSIANPEWRNCWLEDGKFYGYAVANDRGPMSCFLIAAKALRKAGYDLSGLLYLTACPGECGPEPIEDRKGVAYLGKDIGANYLFHHGHVAPDYAIAAEGTDFGLTWMGCGYATFRVRIFGQSIFRPLLNAPEKAVDHPSPLYKVGPVIDALHEWSLRFERQSRYETDCGIAAPKATISCLQGGTPYGGGGEICSLYVSCDLGPRQRAAQVLHELNAVMRSLGLDEFEVEPMVVRHGFEADKAEVAPLVQSVEMATELALGRSAGAAKSVYSSMWRDHNVFNMNRIPAITTGPTRWRPTPEDLVDSALVYALTSLAVCGRAQIAPKQAASATVYGQKPFS